MDDGFMFLMLIVVCCITSCGTGARLANNQWEADSVKAAHAEYFADENGVSRWRWKECK